MAKFPKHHITHFKNIEINGYKSIKHLTVEFLPGLNILIGKNNAGKTNFLDCLNDILFLHQNKKVTFSSASVEMVSSNQEKFTWEIIKSEKDKASIGIDKTYLPEEKILHNNDIVFDTTVAEHGNKNGLNREILLGPLNLLPKKYDTHKPVWSYVKYNLPENLPLLQEPGQIIFRKASNNEWNFEDSSSIVKYLGPHIILLIGSSTHKVANTNDLKKEIISSAKFAVAPNKISKFSPIQNIRLNENINIYRDDEIIRVENLFIEFLVEDKWMPWSNLSDGTKRIFYLLFEVARIDKGIVLIDEPELGIHPHQFYQLMLFIKEEAEEKQIILSTHSPQTLDFISSEELNRVFVTSYDKNSGTQIRPLTEEQKIKAKQYMKEEFLSDYWLNSDLEV